MLDLAYVCREVLSGLQRQLRGLGMPICRLCRRASQDLSLSLSLSHSPEPPHTASTYTHNNHRTTHEIGSVGLASITSAAS